MSAASCCGILGAPHVRSLAFRAAHGRTYVQSIVRGASWLSSGSQRSLPGPSPFGLRLPRAACGAFAQGLRKQLRVSAAATLSSSTATAPATNPPAPTNGVPPTAPTFQDAIARLQQYWASVGCVVWLPHNTEVGAGTMNPATFLRVLGPEPWNVCYAEPSIRPDDSRYGDNPNRVQRHTQFQVILKPDPGNSQELYLGSLEALGIDTRAHDVRFVEDNWESPVLGAWGLGWEVWLDGMEVTQFTYFQQAGGKVLEAPAVEITYGLERILMALQGVGHFKDIRYSQDVTYGELFLQNEYEMSRYNLDEADIEEQRTRFALYEAEAKRMLERRLPIPAYDHLLKLSHTFNLLDARGAVGVTERANCFAAMRALAREVTALWLARREEQGHPLGLVPPPAAPSLVAAQAPTDTAPRTFVLEIGTEELPPDDVESALQQLREKVPPLLQRLRLTHAGVRVEGTPRRLAVLVDGLEARQAPVESRVRGPTAAVAFKEGAPTKALEGFCRKNGVVAGEVVREKDAKGTEYVWAVVKDGGRSAAEVLTEELGGLVSGLAFRRSMRWRGDTAFSRPVRWLLALHGSTPLPFSWGVLQASGATRVLRNAAQPEVQVPSAEEYEALMAGHRIQLGVEARKQGIWEAVVAAAASVGGEVPAGAQGDVLEEVNHLVESPTVVLGSFDPAFLQLPKEVLVMVMRKHQRYFPVQQPGSGELLPHFVTVANGAVDVPLVAAGNGAVLRARFEDAAFFYREDLKQPLAAFRPKLAGTMFQKDLGSLLDKADRTERLVPLLAAATGLDAATDVAAQAAHLAKADLATSTVMEMTALAGTMGRHYALRQGLPADVATAIFEAVLPRQAGDEIPRSPAGILVAVADRLDSLVGLTAAGCAPTAASDPYALRRSAYGMLQALVGNGVRMSLRGGVAAAAGVQPVAVGEGVRGDVVEFVTRRLEQLLVDGGVAPETVRAVLAERADDPALAAQTVKELQAEVAAGEGSRLRAVMGALARPTRIVRGKEVAAEWQVDASRFDCPEEAALHEAYSVVRAQVEADMGLPQFLDACLPLAAPIDAFFEKVFVMAEDETVRQNRLALLRDVAALSRGIADFSQLPGF